jgi:hypothetical protein
MGGMSGQSGGGRAEDRDDLRERLLRAFPTVVHADVSPAIDRVPISVNPPVGLVNESNNRLWLPISFDGETLEIPARIYNSYSSTAIESLSAASRAAAGCIYTRHHDGLVRQRALELLLGHDAAWTAPFIVQLLGEYVVEICLDVERFLSDRLPELPKTAHGLTRFVESNRSFMALTRARATSYWAEYYRLDFLRVDSYPAVHALDVIERHVS